jgi:hypothetical protein
MLLQIGKNSKMPCATLNVRWDSIEKENGCSSRLLKMLRAELAASPSNNKVMEYSPTASSTSAKKRKLSLNQETKSFQRTIQLTSGDLSQAFSTHVSFIG